MNKNNIRVFLLLFAAGIILFIILKSRSPFGKGNSSFASEPKKEITKIEFSSEGRKMYLAKDGDKWLINGQFETRRSSILFIERILTEMKIKSPVSSELYDKEIIQAGIKPVRVKVYEKRRLLKTFLVYKTRSNIYGNIMKIRERSKPFIVHVPGHDSDIGSVFSVNELFWQPYKIFNLLPSEISTVVFENLSDSSASFSIFNKNQHYILSDLTGVLSGWDSTLVTRYLTYFTWIPFESWALEIGEKEKKIIQAQEPLYRISVTSARSVQTVLTLWERMTGTDSLKTMDSDRVIGKTQTNDEFFIMRYYDIDPLIKKPSYFFRE